MVQNSFIQKVAPLYQSAKNACNTPILASVLIAQACLESNFGQSELAQKANNLAGMKASWPFNGKKYSKSSEEEIGGNVVQQVSDFAFFDSWEDCIKYHANFCQNSDFRKTYYQNVLSATTYAEQARALSKTYATDSGYGEKLISLINTYSLTNYDENKKKEEKPLTDNLGLKLVWMPVPEWNHGVKQTYDMTPEYLTIHNTANDASAIAEISYMIGNTNWVSYHIAVDDEQAVHAIPFNKTAWHCGDGADGTGNRKSIGIEICHSLTPGNPRYPKAEENGAKMAAIVLHQMGWGIDRIRKHQDWSGKYCPHRILDNGDWEKFKQKVQQYLNQLKHGTTQEEKKEEENDMITISAPNRGIALIQGGTFFPILDPKDPVAFWNAGAKHVQVSTATFDAFQGKSQKSTLDDATVEKLIKGLK